MTLMTAVSWLLFFAAAASLCWKALQFSLRRNLAACVVLAASIGAVTTFCALASSANIAAHLIAQKPLVGVVLDAAEAHQPIR